MQLKNYRHYLQREFEKRKVRNAHYSLRAYARDLGTSPSRLSEAINGKRGISSDLARKFISGLQLEGVDATIFEYSVEAEHARSKLQKQQAEKRLQKVLSEVENQEHQQKTFTVVDWVTEAVLKLSEREPVIGHSERAASKLGVPLFMVVDSLRFLTRLGFIKGEKKFKTFLQNRGQGKSLNVEYVQILEQSQKAYLESATGNHFYHQALLLEKKHLATAHRILRQAMDEIRDLETKSKNAKVSFLAYQIFNIEKEGTPK